MIKMCIFSNHPFSLIVPLPSGGLLERTDCTHNFSTSWWRALNIGTVSQLVFLQLWKVSSMLVCVLCTLFVQLTKSLATHSGHLPHFTGTLGHWFKWSWIWEAEFRMISKTVTDTVVHTNLTSSWFAAVSSLQWLQATFLNGHSPSTWLSSLSVSINSLHPGLGHLTGLYLQSRQWLL